MPESLGTMVIKVTSDASGVVVGMTQARAEALKLRDDSAKTGAQLRGMFDDGRASAKQFFDNLRGGNFGSLLQQGRDVARQFQQFQSSIRQGASPPGSPTAEAVKGGAGMTEAAGAARSLATELGGAARAGGIAVAVFSALYQQSRSASRELTSLGRQSQRLGVSTNDVQILNRSFERLGIDAGESEETINRLSMHLGELRTHADAPIGRSLRQLGIDPEQFAQANLLQQTEQLADALKAVRDPTERASLASDFFGRSWMRNAELFRRGGDLIREEVARAGRNNDLFSEESIRASQRAELAWYNFGRRFTDIGRTVRSTLVETFGFVSERLANRFNETFGAKTPNVRRPGTSRQEPGFDQQLRSLLDNASDAHTALEGLTNLPANTQPLAAGAQRVELENRLRLLKEEADLLGNSRQLAEEAGFVGANATRQELAAVQDLIKARRELDKIGASEADLHTFDQGARAIALARVTSQTRDAVGDFQNQLRFEGVGLRTHAFGAGFVGPGANASDLAQVKDLVETFDRFRNQPGVHGEDVEALRGRLAGIAQDRRSGAALIAAEEGEVALALRRSVEMQTLFGHEQAAATARARELQEIGRGIPADIARSNRLTAEGNDLLDRRRTILTELRTPLDEFNTQRADIDTLRGRGQLTPDQANRARGSALLRLESSQFPLPGSLALSGSTRGSVESAREEAERQTRAEIQNQDPQERVRLLLEAADQRQKVEAERQRALGEALQSLQRDATRAAERTAVATEQMAESLNTASD